MAPRPPTPLQQAQAIVGAQYKPVDYATAQANKRASAEQQALKDATLAFVQQLQAGVAPAGQAYDQAVQQQQGLAQGAAALLANANPNQQIQSSLQAVNAPAEQKAQLASQTQRLFPGAGAVLNVEQGTIPGASLLAQKAAQQQYSAGLPTVAALSGEQSLRGLLASAADTRDKLMEQRLGIGGQLPGLVQSLTQQGVQNAQADRAFGLQKNQFGLEQSRFGLDQKQFGLEQAKFKADLAYNDAKLKADTAAARAQATGDAQDRADANYWKGQANQRAVERNAIDKARAASVTQRGGSAGLQYKTNKDGSIDIFNPNTGAVARIKGPSGSKGTQGLSISDKRQYAKTAGAIASRAFHGYPDPTDSTKKVYDSYQEAMQNMLAQQIPLPIAQRALNAYWTSPGMHQPGEPPGEGRPLFSFQQRKAGAGRKPVPQAKPAKTNKRGAVRSPVRNAVPGTGILGKP